MQTLLSNLYFNIPSFAIRRRKSRITKYVSAKSLNSYRSHIAKEVFSFSGIKKTQKLELQKYALPRLLKYEDRNSMAFSIESRVPFVSKDLIECGLSLPSNYLVNNGWTKYAVRKTMNKKLPDKIIWNTIKRGFDIPEHEWMQHLKPGLIKWIGEMKDNDVINKNTLLSSLENACTINEIRVLWPIISVALWMKFEDIYE
jgi:asparagine synthase (glutamine-hydrolysing)